MTNENPDLGLVEIECSAQMHILVMRILAYCGT